MTRSRYMRLLLAATAAALAFCGTAQASTLTLRRATTVAHHYVSRDIRLGSTTTAEVTSCNRISRRRVTCFVNETGGWQVLANWPISVSLSRDGRFVNVRRTGPIAPVPYRERV